MHRVLDATSLRWTLTVQRGCLDETNVQLLALRGM